MIPLKLLGLVWRLRLLRLKRHSQIACFCQGIWWQVVLRHSLWIIHFIGSWKVLDWLDRCSWLSMSFSLSEFLTSRLTLWINDDPILAVFLRIVARKNPLLLILSITMRTSLVLRLSVSITDCLLLWVAALIVSVSVINQRIWLNQVRLLCVTLRLVSYIWRVSLPGLFLEIGDLLLEKVVGVGRHRIQVI